jgi:LmbE family N-acetylglucosaminyl deacetylase
MTPFRRRLLLLGLLLGLGTAQTAPNPLPAMPPVTSRDTLLIVAPHPDDESLCCAGLIHLARQAGARVAIVWITNGDGFRWDTMLTQRALFPDSGSYQTLAHTRIQEARTAAQSLDVAPDSLYFLGYPDRGVLHLMRDYYQPRVPWRSRYTGARTVIYPDAFEPGAPYEGDRLVRNFNAVLDRVQPTLVFAPSLQDTHPDHAGAGLLATQALSDRGQLGRLRYWIVHGGHGWPAGGFAPTAPQTIAPRGARLAWQELQLDQDSVAAKLRAISAHRSQMMMMEHTMRSFVRTTELYAPADASLPATRRTRATH